MCELMKEVAENRGVKLERNECSVKFFVRFASSSWHTTDSQVEIPEDEEKRENRFERSEVPTHREN